MTNAKNTRRALLTSVMALVICVTMLMGTTFAWFTDTATVAVNKIVSGNLDIALYAGEVVNGALVWDTKETDENTELFDKTALWEPGYTEVAYLKITNEGNLAVKYTLAAHFANEQPSKNAKGEDIYLSKYLKYDVVALDDTNPVPFTTREAASAAATKDITLTNNAYRMDWTGVLNETNDTKYYAIVVYMPITVGNEANYDAEKSNNIAPSIELGIDFVATQNNVELDSFDADYDKNAQFPKIDGIPSKPAQEIVTVGTLTDLQEAFEKASTSGTDTVININKDITLKAGETWTNFVPPVGTKDITINGNDHTITGLNAPLMTGTWGGSGTITFNNLTLANAAISYDALEAGTGTMRSAGAFLAYTDAGGGVVFNDCHVVNSNIECTNDYAGAFVGYSSGDGVEFNNCTVTGTTVKGTSSVGAFVGHAYNITAIGCTSTGNTMISTDDSWRVGAIVGTINTSGTLTNCTEADTTLTMVNSGSGTNSNGVISKLFGRSFGSGVVINGGEPVVAN